MNLLTAIAAKITGWPQITVDRDGQTLIAAPATAAAAAEAAVLDVLAATQTSAAITERLAADGGEPIIGPTVRTVLDTLAAVSTGRQAATRPLDHGHPVVHVRLADALVAALTAATWPSGARVIDIAPEVLEQLVIPHLEQLYRRHQPVGAR